MIWENFVSQIVVRSRRKVITTTVVYGLSLAVRYTSAAGEVIEIPPQPTQNASTAFAIMTTDGTQCSFHDWRATIAQLFAFRHAEPLSAGPSRPSCLLP